MTYTGGDALGIIPQNCPTEVDSLLRSLHCSGRELVPTPSFCYSPKPQEPQLHLREALIKYFDLKVVKMELVKLLVEGVTSEEEKEEGKRLLCNGVSVYLLVCACVCGVCGVCGVCVWCVCTCT